MPKLPFHILFILAFTCAGKAFAQNDSMQDTVVSVVEAPASEEDEEDTTRFSLVTQQYPVSVRQVPKAKLDSLRSADDFWYANTAPEKKKTEAETEERPHRNLLDQEWFRDLLWVIVLCSFIAVVLWYLASSNVLIFRRKAKKILEEDIEETTDDIFALSYDKEIGRAEEAKDFRQAVRLWYLRVLKELAEKGRIEYRYGRTNSDYVSQLFNTPYHRDFFRLTRNFEYTWYGQFDLSAEAYDMMRRDFLHFKNTLQG